MTTKNLSDLRKALFETLAGVQRKENPLDLATAKAVCEISSQIIQSAKVEVDYHRATGNDQRIEFIEAGEDRPGLPTITEQMTSTGSRSVALVAGGSVTSHKMRG